ncbi:MAG: 50S ribosome-binding protein YggL [Thermodesulfobacteriota bacterium]
MKKRLRKKKHYGEFTEWGRQLIVTRNRRDGFDEFLDAFIEEAIEANGCYCGGGGKEDNLDVVVELGRRSNDSDARLKKITAWLDTRPDVHNWEVGEECDIWHGDFQDIDEKIEHPHAPDRQEKAPASQ